MRHSRSKAARKTLQYFRRTIGLKANSYSPYYSILLDATFVVAIFQQKHLPLDERICKILQCNPHHSSHPNTNINSTSTHQNKSKGSKKNNSNSKNNNYFITQAAVDELQMVHNNLVAKKHVKAIYFQQALEWIQNECIILERKNKSNLQEETNDQEKEDTKAYKTKEKEKAATNFNMSAAQEDFLYHVKEKNNPSKPNSNKSTDNQHHDHHHHHQPYVVASQDETVLDPLRNMGIVPIIRLANHSVLLLEQPSKQSQLQFQGLERQKWHHPTLPDAERALVDFVRQHAKAEKTKIPKHSTDPSSATTNNSGATGQQRTRIAKKAKGPNPLSCKKRKQPSSTSEENTMTTISATTSKKRRLRARKHKETPPQAAEEKRMLVS